MEKKIFKSTLIKLNSNVWGLCFLVPLDVVEYFKAQKVTRFLFSINNTEELPRAMISTGEGRYYIYLNKELAKKQRLVLGDEVTISIRADQSKYGMPMPEELSEAFIIFPLADEYFHKLTPGKQRTLIHLVAKPKREETRVKKAVQILEYLEHVSGKLDFKELNQWFKNHPGF